MRPIRTLLVVTLLTISPSVPVVAQALTSLASLRVRYNTSKVSSNPQGELKMRIDSLDAEIAEASRLGRNAELRRLLAKGTTLLAGRPWTDVADYASSLVLRTDRVVVESAKPFMVRVEQLHDPAIQLHRTLTARAVLRRPIGARGVAAPGEVVKQIGTFEGVSRDLRDSPFQIELDLRDVPDGAYQLSVEILDESRSLGTASLALAVRKGLDDLVTRLESAATRAPEDLRADILYPADRMRNVNRGRLELRTFDADRDFADASQLAAALAEGRDPYAGRTGDFKRHYALAAAGEVMPYRLYVPTTYRPTRAAPLIVALHGLGGTEDSFFEAYGRRLPEHAEKRGYIIAAPLGFRVDGGYGYGVGAPPADAAVRRSQELSEQDVLQVLQHVRRLYRIDDDRIYLMGHSMGAIGTWKLAAKYPDHFAGLGMFAGTGNPATVERIKHIPQFVVHGDADPTVPVRGSRGMVEALKTQNADVQYIEVAGGNHGNIVEPNFAAMFDFFDARRKGRRPTP